MCENHSSQEVIHQPREDSKETEVAAARSRLKSGCWKTQRGLLTLHRAIQTLASLHSLGPAETLQAARHLLLSPPCIKRGDIPPQQGQSRLDAECLPYSAQHLRVSINLALKGETHFSSRSLVNMCLHGQV